MAFHGAHLGCSPATPLQPGSPLASWVSMSLGQRKGHSLALRTVCPHREGGGLLRRQRAIRVRLWEGGSDRAGAQPACCGSRPRGSGFCRWVGWGVWPGNMHFSRAPRCCRCRWPQDCHFRGEPCRAGGRGQGGAACALPLCGFLCGHRMKELYFSINEGGFCHELATGWKSPRPWWSSKRMNGIQL